MDLFDKYIDEVRQRLDENQQFVKQRFKYNQHSIWPILPKEQLILQHDTCIELGKMESFSFIMWTEDFKKINDNDITLYGRDVSEIASQNLQSSSPFGKIVLLGCDPFSEDNVYPCFEQMDMVRFRLNLKGYMLRGFTQRNQEWSRISHNAISEGFSLEVLANELMREYKKLPFVRSTEIVMLTESTLIKMLMPLAEKCSKIPSALNKIFDNLIMDCKSCDDSEVCNEIEGLKELHKQSVSSSL